MGRSCVRARHYTRAPASLCLPRKSGSGASPRARAVATRATHHMPHKCVLHGSRAPTILGYVGAVTPPAARSCGAHGAWQILPPSQRRDRARQAPRPASQCSCLRRPRDAAANLEIRAGCGREVSRHDLEPHTRRRKSFVEAQSERPTHLRASQRASWAPGGHAPAPQRERRCATQPSTATPC